MHEPLAAPVILHIPTSAACNNRCEFCIDNGRWEQRFSWEQHLAQLTEARAFTDAVLFTGGEPTLNRELPRLIDAARAQGFVQISLITNGRRLADPDLCVTLLRAGLTEITVSLHGPDPATHDAITRRPGSWEQTRRGLDHLAQLRRTWPLRLKLNCTLVRKNLGSMRQMAALAKEIGVDSLNFNTVEPRGRALEDVACVVPRYTDVVETASRSELDFSTEALSLSRIPACAGGQDWVQEDYRFTTDSEPRGYVPEAGKVRGPMCAGCVVLDRCPGIWEAYALRYGWDELVTVSDPTPLRGEVLRVDTGAPDLNGVTASPPEAWRRQVREGYLRGYREVLLSGGEPLLHRDFPAIVRRCRELGFTHVSVQSSARLLTRAGLVATIARLGVDHVTVTLAGADHAPTSRRAFAQTLRGVATLTHQGVPYSLRYTGPRSGRPAAERLAARLLPAEDEAGGDR